MARRKIVTMLRNMILQHTLNPTSLEYTTVLTKLVEKFPKLKDQIGNGIVRLNH